MVTLAALVVCLVLGALAVLQVLVAAGRPLGRFVWGGRYEVLPTGLRVASALSVLLYAVIAVVVLDRAGLVDVVAEGVATVGTWVVTGYFFLGVVMNALSRSRAERAVMTPACLVLGLASLVVALS